jgi:hypothetical protein
MTDEFRAADLYHENCSDLPRLLYCERHRMHSLIIRKLGLLICLAASLSAQAQFLMPEPNWDRGLALQTARNADTQALLKPLFQMARSGNSNDLLDSLHSLQIDADLSAPVIDYLLFSFTLGLADLDANSVNPEVLDFLSGYRVRTLVAHDEYPRKGVALFNIRAAAFGVRYAWDRQLANSRAKSLMHGPADQWLSSYLAASPTGRRGFVDALDSAPADRLQALGHSALVQLDERPELTVIAARVGLQTGDFELLRQSVTRGGGADLPGILEAASRELSVEQNTKLLNMTLQKGSETAAGLAIAQLAPAHLDQPEVRNLLFSSLASRRLGAGAALVLGASKDPEIQQRLAEIAAHKTGLERQRAILAISTRKTSPEAER